jgi:hypothetical protein
MEDNLLPKKDIGGSFIYGPSGRSTRPRWIQREHIRYIPAIAVTILPFFFLFIFQMTIKGSIVDSVSVPNAALIHSSCEGVKNPPSEELLKLGIRASDISGRFAFAIPSVSIRVLSIISVVFAFFVIFRRTTVVAGVVSSIASLALGLLVGHLLSHEQGTRKTLIIPIAKAAEAANLSTPQLEEYINHNVDLNSFYGVMAMVVLLCALGVVSIRARDEELTPMILRQRLFDLRWSLILAAAILVMTVIITRALVDWQLNYLCEEFAGRLKPVGAALANYWGAGSSGFLLVALLPAYFSWNRDVIRWTLVSKPEGTEKDRRALIESEYLDFAPSTSITTLLTIGVPALSGPLLEVMKGLIDKIH